MYFIWAEPKTKESVYLCTQKNMQYSKTEMIKDNFQPWPWLRGCLKDPTFGEEGTIVLWSGAKVWPHAGELELDTVGPLPTDAVINAAKLNLTQQLREVHIKTSVLSRPSLYILQIHEWKKEKKGCSNSHYLNIWANLHKLLCKDNVNIAIRLNKTFE